MRIAASCRHLAVGRQDEAEQVGRAPGNVTLQSFHAAGHVPEFDWPCLLPQRHKRRAVWREANVMDHIVMRQPRPPDSAVWQFPQDDAMVAAGGGQQLAIGRKGDRHDGHLMSVTQASPLVPGGYIPQQDRPILAARRQRMAVA